jgi:hypothetical protein
MMTSYERSDIIHIMKMNRLSLVDSDSAHLSFSGLIKDKDFQINILAAENLPSVSIKQNGKVIVNETVKSIDDLKIFLEERLYQFIDG